MVFEAIQSLIQIFSMPLLYAIVAWFAVVGFAARSALVMILTKVKRAEIIPVSLRLHAMSLMIAYVISPVGAIITISFNQALFSNVMNLAIGPNLYVWYSVIMIISLRCLLCQTFVSVTCNTWKKYLIFVDSFVAFLGYIFLSAAHLV